MFADLAAGKTFGELRQPVSEKARAAAKRIFPDADDSFIKRNYNDISFIADVERKCAECINTVDCPYSGHQLKALGNGCVPQQVYLVFAAIVEVENEA